MSVRGGDDGLVQRIRDLEDRVRQLEQGVGLGSMTFRRFRLTDRTGTAKFEFNAVPAGIEIYDLVDGGDPLLIPVPGSSSTSDSIGEILFSVNGTPTAGDVSAPWSPPSAGVTITSISVLATTVGSTSTVLTLSKNGTTVATLTLPAAASRLDSTVSIPVAGTDIITLTVTTVGTSVADVSTIVRYTYF